MFVNCLRVQYKNINFARKQKGESLLQYYRPPLRDREKERSEQ